MSYDELFFEFSGKTAVLNYYTFHTRSAKRESSLTQIMTLSQYQIE